MFLCMYLNLFVIESFVTLYSICCQCCSDVDRMYSPLDVQKMWNDGMVRLCNQSPSCPVI